MIESSCCWAWVTSCWSTASVCCCAACSYLARYARYCAAIADARCTAALLLGPLAVIDSICVVTCATLYVRRKLAGVWFNPSWLTTAAATGVLSASEMSVVIAAVGSDWD